jgi:hypothetical protein
MVVVAVEVRPHTAAEIMGGRHHGDGLGGDVDAEGEAALVDLGEPAPEEVGPAGRDVQENTVLAGALEFLIDGARDDVAGRELAPGVGLFHEALPRAIF